MPNDLTSQKDDPWPLESETPPLNLLAIKIPRGNKSVVIKIIAQQIILILILVITCDMSFLKIICWTIIFITRPLLNVISWYH